MRGSRIALVVAVALVVAACQAGPVSPGPQGSGLAADTGRLFSIEEVGLGPEGWVTLHNYTDVPAGLGQLYLCQAPGCVRLPDVVVEPESMVRIAVGSGSGLEDVVMTNAELELRPSDGEIALYSTDDTDDANRLWAYLEWGSTPHAGTAAAIEAGRWREGSYAPTAPDATRLYRTEGGLWVFD